MTYQPRPNASGDTLSASKNQIRTNFEIIRDDFAINHAGFDQANEGKHKFVQMPVQAAPAPAAAADEVTMYVADDSDSVAQLFIRGETSGSSYQLSKSTSGVDANITEFGTNTAYVANHTGGWTFLPGGLIMMYGLRSSLATDSLNTITFPYAFPTAVFSVQVTPVQSNNSVNTTNVRDINGGLDGFRIYNTSSAGVTSLYYVAIGN